MQNVNFPTFSHSFLLFIEQNIKGSKICRIIYGTLYKRYRESGNILTTSELNYITNRKDGNISYLPKGKTHEVNDNGEWKREGRQDGKPAKVIRKIFNPKFIQRCLKDADFEQFANLYKSAFLQDGYFLEMRSNKEIQKIYNLDINENFGGSLQGSCMRGEGNLLDIYKFCDKLQILCLFSNNDEYLHGRALIWDISENFANGEKVFLMDRIYVSHDWQYETFLNYAKEKGFWHKIDYKSYQNKMNFIDSEGNIIGDKRLTIKLDDEHEQYPYIDTFTYGYEGELNNYGGDYTYNNTDGTRDGEDEREECSYDRNYYHRDDMYYIEYSSRYMLEYSDCYIHDRYAVNCFMPNGNEQYVCRHDSHVVEINGKYYHEEHCEICEIDGDYHHVDDCTYSDYLNEWLLHADAVYCEDLEDYFPKDDCIEFDGGYHYKYDNDSVVSFWNDDRKIYLHIEDERIHTTKDGIHFLKSSEAYKKYRKQCRRDRRNRLGRKNRNRKTTK